MFWDRISSLYDLFENVYNRKVYNATGQKVAELIDSSDTVLECACGTGAISKYIAQKCKMLVATDFSEGMLNQTRKKCRAYTNIVIEKADIKNTISAFYGRFDGIEKVQYLKTFTLFSTICQIP